MTRVKNGGGHRIWLLRAEWHLVKGPPFAVYATTRKLKWIKITKVDDDCDDCARYPDGTAIIEASWDWPYSKDVVAVYGPKGSLLARHSTLQRRLAETRGRTFRRTGELDVGGAA